MDVFGGEIRRRDVFPVLVLHLISREPAYGNRLIEGQWEHPDRRTRRFYSITSAGRKEYRRLVAELEPFLDSVIESVTLIKREIYGSAARRGGRR